MARDPIDSSEIKVGDPLRKELIDKIKDNDDDHETRIDALEGGASKVFVIDKIINRQGGASVGVWAYATESEFQNRFGTDWVLDDSQSIVGSDLATLRTWTTTPDARGRFIRMKDNGASVDLGGERALGNLQADANSPHNHSITYNVSTGPGSTPVASSSLGSTATDSVTATTWNTSAYSMSSSGSESRGKNICANFFIRKNDAPGVTTGAELFRAPTAFQLVSAIITNLEVGSAGTLEIDLQKGSALGSLSTIFSTQPSVTAAAGAYASSSNAVFSDNDVAANDWLRLDISSWQTAQQRFHCYIIGELS